jgi:uncharacterized membrane protein YccC
LQCKIVKIMNGFFRTIGWHIFKIVFLFLNTFHNQRHLAFRQAVRMTVAALLAFIVTRLLGLQQGYWAVVTCLVVVQGTLGATISAGLSRFAGTAVGAIAGVVSSILFMNSHVPEWIVLLAAIAPLSLVAAAWPLFRLAPLTGSLVLLLTGSSGLSFALGRVVEIGVGGLIGVLVSLVVLPGRAAGMVDIQGAKLLRQLGAFARAQLTDADSKVLESGEKEVRKTFLRLQIDMKEAASERAMSFVQGPSPEWLLHTLQCIEADVTMLGHAVQSKNANAAYYDLAKTIETLFCAEAEALLTKIPAPSLAPLEVVAGRYSRRTPLGFLLVALCRDLVELHKNLDGRAKQVP